MEYKAFSPENFSYFRSSEILFGDSEHKFPITVPNEASIFSLSINKQCERLKMYLVIIFEYTKTHSVVL